MFALLEVLLTTFPPFDEEELRSARKHPVKFVKTLLEAVEAEGWNLRTNEWEPTPRVLAAARILGKIETAEIIVRAAKGDWSGENYPPMPKLEQRLYRAKAIACLLLGRYVDEPYKFDGIEVTVWNLREYGTEYGPGGSFDSLQVAPGVSDWRVNVEHESWP